MLVLKQIIINEDLFESQEINRCISFEKFKKKSADETADF